MGGEHVAIKRAEYMNNTTPRQPHLVSIQRSTYDEVDVDALLKPLGGISQSVHSGERVLLKTNLLQSSDPSEAVVTHPAVVRAVALAVQKVGGIPIIGDSPLGPFTKRRLQKVYQKAGLLHLSESLGVELNYDTSVKSINVPQAKTLKKTPYCSFVLNADKIIALPKLKTHSYMIMTLATKIMYGAIPGLTKAKYHSLYLRRAAFASMLLDVLSIRQPDLIVMDGVTGMQGNGPAGGTPVNVGLLLASHDAVALDLAVCDILGIEPVGIPTLRQAKLRHLWPTEVRYPLRSPQEVRYTGFLLPSTANYLLTGEKTPPHFPVTTEACTACGQCVEICPRHAIQLHNNRAVVDYNKCIRCYCCHESCPYKAIDLEVQKQ
ncbi:MAG: DUF362 domain-containing protein [Candidatus Thermoplasmatota archaeon]|nr:DUF362 domain-containing protein [Candidatus Thermoplasmatota archaeon]